MPVSSTSCSRCWVARISCDGSRRRSCPSSPGRGSSGERARDGVAAARRSLASEIAPQQKTPRRGGGALLGLLQGGEICISIYVDPWEVGEPSCVVGADCGKQPGPYVRRETQPTSFLSCSF